METVRITSKVPVLASEMTMRPSGRVRPLASGPEYCSGFGGVRYTLNDAAHFGIRFQDHCHGAFNDSCDTGCDQIPARPVARNTVGSCAPKNSRSAFTASQASQLGLCFNNSSGHQCFLFIPDYRPWPSGQDLLVVLAGISGSVAWANGWRDSSITPWHRGGLLHTGL